MFMYVFYRIYNLIIYYDSAIMKFFYWPYNTLYLKNSYFDEFIVLF